MSFKNEFHILIKNLLKNRNLSTVEYFKRLNIDVNKKWKYITSYLELIILNGGSKKTGFRLI